MKENCGSLLSPPVMSPDKAKVAAEKYQAAKLLMYDFDRINEDIYEMNYCGLKKVNFAVLF